MGGEIKMKVKDLIEKLKLVDPELGVILQKDSEGNNYSPVSDVDVNVVYKAQTSYYGEVYDKTWTYEDADFETKEEWEKFKKETPDCVVLYPLN